MSIHLGQCYSHSCAIHTKSGIYLLDASPEEQLRCPGI